MEVLQASYEDGKREETWGCLEEAQASATHVSDYELDAVSYKMRDYCS